MHAAKWICAIAASIALATGEHLRHIKLHREEATCAVSTESQALPAVEACTNPTELALRTVKLLKKCSEESTPSEQNLDATAKIYTSINEKYLKWDDLCADENCLAVAFCKDKVMAVADEKKEEDGPTMIKSHFAVNVLTYEIARWLFLAENAVDSKNNVKFEGTGAQLEKLPCVDWNKPLMKRDTPNRSGEDRKKPEEKANNYKFLTVKLEKMEQQLLSCVDATFKDRNALRSLDPAQQVTEPIAQKKLTDITEASIDDENDEENIEDNSIDSIQKIENSAQTQATPKTTKFTVTNNDEPSQPRQKRKIFDQQEKRTTAKFDDPLAAGEKVGKEVDEVFAKEKAKNQNEPES